jgi:hypothetical protein
MVIFQMHKIYACINKIQNFILGDKVTLPWSWNYILQWLRGPWQIVSHNSIETLWDSLIMKEIGIHDVKNWSLWSLSLMHKTSQGSLFPSCEELGTMHSEQTYWYYFS